MSGIFNTLIDFLDEEEWKYEILEGESAVRFYFKGSSGSMFCFAHVDEEKDWLLFYSYLPVNTPDHKLAMMAEFVTRANRGMRIGNFELDYEDGEIRYKTSIDIEGGALTNKMIDNLLRANLSTMNRYYSGMMELIYSSEEPSPKEIIHKIESDMDHDSENDMPGIDSSTFEGHEFPEVDEPFPEKEAEDDEEGEQRQIGS